MLFRSAAGDTVLSLVSRRLRHLLGPCDLLARFGGDELAMILDLSDQSDRSPANLEPLAASMAARLTAVMGHSLPVADRRITVSLSIGYSLIRASDASIDDALRRSDEAMYAVKRQRRGLEG